MPSRKQHAQIGMISGGGYAFYRARNAPADHALAETVGGILGGYIGGLLPDLLEPATSSYHRDIAHSVAAGGLLHFVKVAEWEAMCRENAARCLSLKPDGTRINPNGELQAFLWRVLAGLAIGLVVGYASHLALDATTPRGIPILAR
jgi:membrane-bound metal-dependent hydrolase YbcI (DUF457 family)